MNLPSPEFRIKSLENRVSKTEASIEELADGLTTIRQEIKQGYMDIGVAPDSHADGIMEEIRKRTEPIEKRLDRIETTMATKDDISALKGDISTIETRVGQIETTMATKDDISALKGDISRLETCLNSHENLLRQILDRLPPKQ